jgi:hypothetical protein
MSRPIVPTVGMYAVMSLYLRRVQQHQCSSVHGTIAGTVELRPEIDGAL